MSSDELYYRQQAQEAQKQADRAISDHDRAKWLAIAESWLALIHGRPPTDAALTTGVSEKPQ
jgi:hypothetical protein